MGSPFQPSVASAVSSLHCRYVMDLLPSAALHDLSGSGASSADESGEPSPPLRLALTVGQSRLLPHFTGTCIRDTVSWKGSQVTRVAVLVGSGCFGVVTGGSLWHPSVLISGS